MNYNLKLLIIIIFQFIFWQKSYASNFYDKFKKKIRNL